jgi:hypothetical protein
MRGTYNQIVLNLIRALNDGEDQPARHSTPVGQREDVDPILRAMGCHNLADWIAEQLPDPWMTICDR